VTEDLSDPAQPLDVRRAVLQLGHTFGTKGLIAASRFGLLIVLARSLPPSDFGAYAVITTTIMFGVMILGLNANVYIYRAVPGASTRQAHSILLSVAALELALTGLTLALLLWSGAFRAGLALLKLEDFAPAFVLALPWLVGEIVCQELLSFLYASQRIEEANVLDGVKQASWVPLIVGWSVIAGSVSLENVVGAALAGTWCGAGYGIAVIRPWRGRLDRRVARAAIAFGSPLIGSGVSEYAVRLADRYVLTATRTLTETGIYALATSFANVLYSFSAVVVANTLTPAAVRNHNLGRARERDAMLWLILKYSLGLFLVGTLAFVALGPFLFDRIVRSDYAASVALFPWIAVSLFIFIAARPAHNRLWLENRSGLILVIEVASASITVGLDLALIPAFGAPAAIGAAVAGNAFAAVAKYSVSGFWRSFDPRAFLSLRSEIEVTRRVFVSARRRLGLG
jgi:O-antigen/teichoic acid export membrane protein